MCLRSRSRSARNVRATSACLAVCTPTPYQLTAAHTVRAVTVSGVAWRAGYASDAQLCERAQLVIGARRAPPSDMRIAVALAIALSALPARADVPPRYVRGETIIVHGTAPPKVAPRPRKNYHRMAPPYSDEAI